MIVCPVCENQQAQGDACDVCGKAFGTAAAPQDLPAAPLAELEETRLEGGDAPVAVQALTDLEVTRQRGGPDLPAAPVPDLERTRLEAQSDTPILPLDELELGRAEDDGQRTEVPFGALVCRYCRHEQMVGAFCDNCGMRLPRFDAPVVEGLPTFGDEDVWGTCPKCGSRAKVGRACGSCGVVMQMPEA